MAIDLSNKYVLGAVVLVALYLPMFSLIKAYKVAKHPEYRTKLEYWKAGLLLLGSILFYAFVLDYGERIIIGGCALFLLAAMLVVNFFNNRQA
jgi:hypothetical protein